MTTVDDRTGLTTAESGTSGPPPGVTPRFASVFWTATGTYLVCTWLGWTAGMYLSKPLIAAGLVLVVVAAGRASATGLALRWLVIALVAAMLGDMALLADATIPDAHSAVFLAGICAFFVMHACYLRIYVLARRQRRTRWAVGAVLAWLGLNAAFASPLTGVLQSAVLVYSGLLLTMVAVSFDVDRRTALGACIFVCSDTMIAATVVEALPADRVVESAIVVTYAVAQYLIVTGLLRRTA